MEFRHLALLVGDLRSAEEYYADLFGLTVLFREGPIEDGDVSGPWGTVPPAHGWDEIDSEGIGVGMSALGRDSVVLALFAQPPTGAQTFAIGLVAGEDEIDRIASRLPDDVTVETRARGQLEFVDRFGVRWQLSSTRRFTSAGERAGVWFTPR